MSKLGNYGFIFMPKILLWPHKKSIEVEEGTRLLEVLQDENRNILSIYRGIGECETCVVNIQNLPESSFVLRIHSFRLVHRPGIAFALT